MLVEDDDDHAGLVRLWLERALGGQHAVIHVDRLSKARERLATTEVSCVLLDLSLPDARQLEGLVELRSIAPDVPIVIFSGQTEEFLAVRAVQDGAQDYLVKGTVDANLLGRAIRYAIARKRGELESRREAMHDPLTDLPNRRLLIDRVEHAIALSRRHFIPFAVLFVDLDGYKEINDRHGHVLGDQVLVTVADRMRETLRGSDTPARYGGDEFAVLCEHVKDEEQVNQIAERLASSIEEPISIEETELRVAASIGIAMGRPGIHMTPEDLVHKADSAMYAAKQQGVSTAFG